MLLLAALALVWVGVAATSPSFAEHGAPAIPDDEAVDFSIPARPLPAAIEAFVRATGWQVGYPSAIARGTTSRAVFGAMPPIEALQAMLEGTGIRVRLTGPAMAMLVAGPDAAMDAADGPLLLDTIDVVARDDAATGAGFQGTPDWVYETPSSVSAISREAIQSHPARNARDLLDSVSGVWANRTEAQNPGIAVNIRGLQDQSRVVTMIDGARQNFQRNAHGSTQRTYVDTAFLREVDIEKSGSYGVGGAGALGGSVNFRTIGADDLIAPGEQYGGELNLTTGTNEYDFDGAASGAVRLSDRFSLLAGLSKKKLGEYDIGEDGIEEYTRPILGGLDKPIFTGSDAWSSLLKGEAFLTEDIGFTLGWLRYQLESSQGNLDEGAAGRGENTQDIVNNTLTAALDWNPDSDLVDLRVRLWYNHLKNTETRESNLIHPETDADYRLASFGGSLENTSRFGIFTDELALNYGVEAFRDDGETAAMNAEIEADPQLEVGFGGLNPSGTRDVASGFANATLQHSDWLTLTGGLRYDWYRMSGKAIFYDINQEVVCQQTLFEWFLENFGFIPPGFEDSCFIPELVTTYPAHVAEIDRSEGAMLPTATVALKPFDWLQPFVKYSHSFRPPTVMEAFVSGGHPGSVGIEFAPNPDLRPEKARTLEVGANISRDGVLMDGDTFRVKVVRFWRDVEDYIVVGTFMPPEATKPFNTYLNLDGTTHMNGLEIEGNYDAGIFYIGGSLTTLDTKWSKSYAYNGAIETTSTGKIISSVYVPPEMKLTIDAGMRLFDETLTLGGRITDVGLAENHFGLLGGYPTKDYRVYDLYGSYVLTEQAKLRFSVGNVTDVAYVPALGEWVYPAPGRTITVSLNLRF